MVQGPSEASGLVVVELRDELRVLRLVRVGRKFHSDRLDGPRWLLAVQVLDGFLRLRPLVEPDEGHTAGNTCCTCTLINKYPRVNDASVT